MNLCPRLVSDVPFFSGVIAGTRVVLFGVFLIFCRFFLVVFFSSFFSFTFLFLSIFLFLVLLVWLLACLPACLSSLFSGGLGCHIVHGVWCAIFCLFYKPFQAFLFSKDHLGYQFKMREFPRKMRPCSVVRCWHSLRNQIRPKRTEQKPTVNFSERKGIKELCIALEDNF